MRTSIEKIDDSYRVQQTLNHGERSSSSSSRYSQLFKAVILAASGIGIGWLISRLWRGRDVHEQKDQSLDDKAIIPYRPSAKYPLLTDSDPELFSKAFEIPSEQSSLFHKLGIVYRSTLDESSPTILTDFVPSLPCATGLALPMTLPSIHVKNPLPESVGFNLFTAFSILTSFIAGARAEYSPALTLMAVFSALPLIQKTEACSVDVGFPGLKDTLNDVRQKFSKDVIVVLNDMDKKITSRLEQVDELGKKFMINLGDQGKILIHEVGHELKVLTEGLEKGVKATVTSAGYEARLIVGAVGNEARFTIERLGEEARLIVKEGGKTAQELIGKFELTGNSLIFNFGKMGKLLMDYAGEKTQLITDETLEKLVKSGEVILSYGGRQMTLSFQEMMKTVEGTAIFTLNHARKLIVETLPDLVIASHDSAEGMGIGFVQGIKKAVFGQSSFQEIRQHVQKLITENNVRKGDITILLRDATKYLQEQSTLSASERADLYIDLLRCVNVPKLNSQDRLWLQYTIAAIAYNDPKLKGTNDYYITSTVTDYFQTKVLPEIANEDLKQAIKNYSFDPIRPLIDPYLNDNEDLFPTSTLRILDAGVSCSSEEECHPPILKKDPESDVPVGTVISLASLHVPSGYVRCDGAWLNKMEYRELYGILGNRYGEEGEKFRVPDYSGLFLRGFKDTSEIGLTFEGTTRLPIKSFEVLLGGTHTHTADSSGEHGHPAEKAGGHVHIVEEGGGHKHSMDQSEDHEHKIQPTEHHSHSIQAGGVHTHSMKPGGAHKHDNGEFKYLLKSNGQSTSPYTDPTPGEPNLVLKGEMIPALDHSHEILSGGSHIHTMNPSGGHSHEMQRAGVHTHEILFDGSHTHPISSAPAHTHEIGKGGIHSHPISESGQHTHQISGGDEETRPKNSVISYLIKAKPGGAAKDFIELQGELQKLKEEQKADRSRFFLVTLLTAAMSLFGRPAYTWLKGKLFRTQA